VTDPYTHGAAPVAEPPSSIAGRLAHLGPSLIVAGSVVGSGELLLTSGLGATAGFVLLWWVLVSCWSKSIVQAELARYVLCSGDTYLRALNRLPGRLRGPRGPIAWPLCLSMIAMVPGLMGLGGVLGGTGQSISLLFPAIDSRVSGALVAVLTMTLLGSGSYRRLERTMLALVVSFTATTLLCAILMQTTAHRMDLGDLVSGFSLRFPVELAVLALAMYGYTGVNAAEISAYTYWCVEKGYPAFVGAERADPSWVGRARGWIRVLQTDVWVTLAILTCATIPFYLLGAGVLHPIGARPEGLDTIRVLSSMFTETLGPWSLWVFGVGAFCILFSTMLSAVGAGARFLPDYAVELGFVSRAAVRRDLWIRVYVLLVPVIAFALYLWVQQPILLVTIGAVTQALLLPVQSGATLWLHRHHLDPRVRPARGVRIALWATFCFQLAMAALLIRITIW
jgi:Mn2+/Fe2+ NRAMP family transporter